MAGYFIVTLEPMLPSTHSMLAPAWTTARLVTRLYTLFDQFWIVVYRQCAPAFTKGHAVGGAIPGPAPGRRAAAPASAGSLFPCIRGSETDRFLACIAG